MSKTSHKAQSGTPPADRGKEPACGDAAHAAERTGQPAAPAAEELDRLRQEAKQAQDQYLRALAEFENSRKRLHREKEEFVRYAAEGIVREMLPILDSLDQALLVVEKPSDPRAVMQGVQLIHRQLLGLLDQEGVKRISTMGEAFDPHKHEAVAQIETQDGTADDVIVEEIQVGYTMHGKVIRPAMVKVAKSTKDQKTDHGGQKSEETENNDQEHRYG